METNRSTIGIEVCIEDASYAESAVRAGANRIEMCSALDLGGLTPTTQSVRKALYSGVPVTAMARIRPGDFVLNDDDIAILQEEITAQIETGADGIVTGALTPEGTVDTVALGWLVDACGGRPVTFHRAFDHCSDRISALEQIIDCGCQRLLTSGGAPTAEQGIAELARIVETAADRIEVIAAGGIRPGCAVDLVRKTAVRWLHLSARRPTPGPSRVLSPGVPPGSATSVAPGERWIMDPALVEELRSELDRQAG
ncbi:MAG TPA: copper homeostasis protein CutC [Planctomycetes bacterium]|nr:copper homeostasis protein CutC [Planctomycetota bacterium]